LHGNSPPLVVRRVERSVGHVRVARAQHVVWVPAGVDFLVQHLRGGELGGDAETSVGEHLTNVLDGVLMVHLQRCLDFADIFGLELPWVDR